MRWRNAPGCILLPLWLVLLLLRWVVDQTADYLGQAVVWCFGENVLNGNIFPTNAQYRRAWPSDQTLNPYDATQPEQHDPPSESH